MEVYEKDGKSIKKVVSILEISLLFIHITLSTSTPDLLINSTSESNICTLTTPSTVKMVRFSSVLIMALSMSLGSVVSALPQATTNGTAPTTTLSPAAASAIVAANPIVFPAVVPTKVPIPGAPSNSTLLQVVPQLAVNKTSQASKRDISVREIPTRRRSSLMI